MKYQLSILILSVLLLEQCVARSWATIVDATIYAGAGYDPYRVEFITESNPFDNANEETGTVDIPSPTATPKEVEENFEEVVPGTPTIAPSLAPTGRDERLMDNGNCPMDQWLYRVRMHDSWGDGWDRIPIRILEMPPPAPDATSAVVEKDDGDSHVYSTQLDTHTRQNRMPTIIFEETLSDGFDGYSYVCLKTEICYEVVAGSGDWEKEIKWDIRSAPVSQVEQYRNQNLVTVAKGYAPAKCQFTIAESDEKICPNECEFGTTQDVEPDEEFTPKSKLTNSPSFMPSDFPSLMPSLVHELPQSAMPSDMPSLLPTSSSSDPPSMVPTRFV